MWYSLKQVPKAEPNADGVWIIAEVQRDLPKDGTLWDVLSEYVEEGHVCVQYEQYKPTIKELRIYWDQLKAHDWQYEYSDDHSVWTRGSEKDRKLRHTAGMSKQHEALWNGFHRNAHAPNRPPIPGYPLRYLCDNARHMVCEPYSIENLHRMAEELDIKRGWYHAGGKGRFHHYDMPKKRIAELTAKCEVVTQKAILQIIKEGKGNVHKA